MPAFRTLDDVELAGRTALVRVDFNVPMEGGRITDATRITRAVPTIRRLLEGGAKVVTYGTSEGADVRLLGVTQSSGALDLELDVFGERRTARLPMVGRYNAWNAAGALAAARIAQVDLDAALQALDGFAGVPGRMQVITTGPFTVIVDFAHTPPALVKALEATRRPGSRTIVVIGSAGERDPGKRGPLGAAAAGGADVAVFAGDRKGIIYVQGQRVANVPEAEILDRMLTECRAFQERVLSGEAKLGEKRVEIIPPDPIGELGSGFEKIASGGVGKASPVTIGRT